jgi:nucleotide-binding universal stress UspA family protein
VSFRWSVITRFGVERRLDGIAVSAPHGLAEPDLVDSSRLADLVVLGVVLGGRRHSDGAGMCLGGLAHAALHHSHCPVVIVPES